jgi:hypothetical protein
MGLLRTRPPGKGEWRLNLRQEQVRRVRDAAEQPRTPSGWWQAHRPGRVRFSDRVPLDAEGRQYYQEREWEARQEEEALRADLRSLGVAARTDRLDQGRRVSVRELQRHHAKRLNAYGRPTADYDRYAGNVEAKSRAADRARELRAGIARAAAERAAARDVLTFGEVPRSGHWRRRHGLR